MTAAAPRTRPLLGLRRRPGRVALAAMRLPQPLLRRGGGRLLGHTFVLITHQGRVTGEPHDTVAMALRYDRATREVVVCSAWGETQWIRNLRAHPAVKVQIACESFTPRQRFLDDDEAAAVALDFRRRHPWRLRLVARVLGWGELDNDQAVHDLVRGRPFVAFVPAEGDR